MTASIMLCSRNTPDQGTAGQRQQTAAFRFLSFAFCLLFSAICFLPTAHAERITVRKADAHFLEDSCQLSAYFDISFNFVVEQALMQGVPLYFISEFTLTRPRWYWLDEIVAQHEQTIKLSYNSLTSQYRITRGSIFQNFATLDAAINTIKHQSAVPIAADRLKGGGGFFSGRLFKGDSGIIAAVRLRLDVTQLPKPLQVNALANNDWNLDSGWYKWIVYPNTSMQQK
ncbi:MAG: DUF4390 domain-containing protein [Gallionellaceae bacterium]|nr:DUF4390 domain-containing protein [Gallionellaceae bacterium]